MAVASTTTAGVVREDDHALAQRSSSTRMQTELPPSEAAELRERAVRREQRKEDSAGVRAAQSLREGVRSSVFSGREEVFMHSRCINAARSTLLATRSCQMRPAPTASELKLWSALRSRQLGVAFRRQAVIGDRIVDFLARQCV